MFILLLGQGQHSNVSTMALFSNYLKTYEYFSYSRDLMSRRIRTLSAAEAARLFAQAWDSDASEEEPDAVTQPDSDDGELDELHAFEESGDEDDDAAGPVNVQQLTRSQTILNQADLRAEPTRDDGPYVLRRQADLPSHRTRR